MRSHVNVLLALFCPSAEAHTRAQDWVRKQSARATCPLTEVAFVRILSNPGFSQNSLTPLKAESLLRENLDHPDRHFWPDELDFHDALAFSIDCRRVQEMGEKLSMSVKSEISSLPAGANPSSGLGPVVHQFQRNSDVIVAAGVPTNIFSSDDVGSNGKMQVEVTATLIK